MATQTHRRKHNLTWAEIVRSGRPTITAAEAMHVLGMGRSAFYESVRAGRVPVVRLTPRKLYVSVVALRRILESDAA